MGADYHMRTVDPACVQDLIRELDAYQAGLYPAESNHLDSVDALRQDHVHMLAVFEGDTAVAMGAVKICDTYAEIKRVYVRQSCRGKGYAVQLMSALEHHAMDQGCRLLRLETGVKQNAAIQLYEKLSYRRCPAFGPYPPDPLSVFMQKSLM